MTRSTVRTFALLLWAIAGGSCADSGASSNPAAPSPAPAPSVLPSGAANVSGNWTGRSGFEQENNAQFYSDVTGTVTQSDRTIQGSFRFTSQGWDGWVATFSGTLAGAANDTQFLGNIEYRGPSSTGTGSCSGQAIFSGRSVSDSLQWGTVALTMTNSVAIQPAYSCRGLMRKLVLVLGRS